MTATSRADVAVGMVRLASMFSTIRAPTPLMAVVSAPSGSATSGAASRAGSAAPSPPVVLAGLPAGALAGGAGAPLLGVVGWAGTAGAASAATVGAPSPRPAPRAGSPAAGTIMLAFESDSDGAAPMDSE